MISMPTATSSPIPIIGAVIFFVLLFVSVIFQRMGKTFIAAGIFGVMLLVMGAVVVFGLGLIPA